MNIKKIIDKKLKQFIPAVGLLLLASCADDAFRNEERHYDNPEDDPDLVCLPINVMFDVSASTRDDGEDSDSERAMTGPEFEDGTDKEHKLDFDTENECFAIFFDKNENVKYMRQLYLSDQLGKGGKVDGAYPEYTVSVVAYVPKKDIMEGTEGYDENSKLSYLLVVLNGGKIYNKIHDEIYNSDNSVKNKKIKDILNLKWQNAACYEGDYLNSDAEDSDGRIGFNKDELYTMTNSAYFKDGKLMTATPITGPAYNKIKDYLPDESNLAEGETPTPKEPTATVYVERMVSKFISPSFDTEVIGSDRVFRPDQNAVPIVVYGWEGETLVSAQKNWRIHLLGWAINGDESESYIFKNIGETFKEDFAWAGWNSEARFRSYWSQDPHYTSQAVKNEEDFYPWQFRKAADRSDIISIQAGLSQATPRKPSLRYNSFNDILNNWNWRSVLHIHENTFDPNGDWYLTDDNNSNKSYLDSRAPVLAGPHLLIAGELYLEKPGGRYIGQFDTVANIYSDRVRRYYRTEVDWVKMFVREFNRSLETQEKMSFPVYDWDENTSGKANHTYVTTPSGLCRLFLRQKDDENFKNFDPTVTTIEGREILLNGKQDTRDVGYKFTPVTFTMIDNLAKEHGVTISDVASVRTGDGRLIPWVEKEKVNWKDFGLVVRSPDGSRLYYDINNPVNNTYDHYDWSYDMYKSLFYEWFGPVDHFYNGYMYYAGEIKHNTGVAHDYYGTVRNHRYTFHVQSINALGIPVDDPDQLIIPGRYNYRDQILVYFDVIGWHSRESLIDVP